MSHLVQHVVVFSMLCDGESFFFHVCFLDVLCLSLYLSARTWDDVSAQYPVEERREEKSWQNHSTSLL